MNKLYFIKVIWCIHVICCSSIEPPTITTKNGVLKGITQTTLFGRTIYSFLGVRYVKAPIGELRFQPSQPPDPWEGVYDATADGPACPQPPYGLPIAEDCLFINIHTPKLPEKGKPIQKRHLLPVIFFIHGGSFTTYSGASAWVRPQYLLDEDVVLVSINYRLAALGFIATGDKLAPGNNGIKDQVQALRWVRDNIEAFGGNPKSVTLFGYSIGGVSASLHMVSPMSKGLFHKVFIMSGSTFGHVIAITEQFELAQKQAELLGCPTDTSENIINCLKTKPAEDMGNSLSEFKIFGDDPTYVWQVVIEPDFGQERFIVENPLISIQCGRIAKVPVITGITKDELISLAYPVISNTTWIDVLNENFYTIAPYSFYYEKDTLRSRYISDQLKTFYFNGKNITTDSLVPLGELYTDSLSGYGVNRGARLLSQYGNKDVFNYLFTYKGRFSNYPGGAEQYVVHFDDLLYVIWNSALFPMFNRTDQEAIIVKTVTNLWSNFAKYGHPTPRRTPTIDGIYWNRFDPYNKKYLNINLDLKIQQNLHPRRYAEWDRLFPLPFADCERTSLD